MKTLTDRLLLLVVAIVGSAAAFYLIRQGGEWVVIACLAFFAVGVWLRVRKLSADKRHTD